MLNWKRAAKMIGMSVEEFAKTVLTPEFMDECMYFGAQEELIGRIRWGSYVTWIKDHEEYWDAYLAFFDSEGLDGLTLALRLKQFSNV